MITFGGGDIRNMSPKIISLIQEKYPNCELNVVIGKSYKNVSEIESITSNYHSLHYYPDANKIKNIMLDSDVAIASGGQTLYELARLGLPTIAIVLVDNQINDIDGWSKKGFFVYSGLWNNKRLKKQNIYYYLDKLENIEQRKNGINWSKKCGWKWSKKNS